MKVKYLRKNLRKTKQELRRLAREYHLKVKFDSSDSNCYLYVWFSRKLAPKHYSVVFVNLPEHKIAYGLYKPGMVAYNTERKIVKWLRKI